MFKKKSSAVQWSVWWGVIFLSLSCFQSLRDWVNCAKDVSVTAYLYCLLTKVDKRTSEPCYNGRVWNTKWRGENSEEIFDFKWLLNVIKGVDKLVISLISKTAANIEGIAFPEMTVFVRTCLFNLKTRTWYLDKQAMCPSAKGCLRKRHIHEKETWALTNFLKKKPFYENV